MAQWVCAACSAAYAVGAPCCPQCGSTDRAEDRVLSLPTIRVACGWDGCRYEDVDRTVRLRPVGIGLVEMPTLLCAGCGRMPLVISHWSPIPEEEEDVPKITVHGGPSNDAEGQGEHGPEPATPPEGNAVEPTGGDATAEEDKTTKPKPARKPRSRKAADSTGSTGLKVTAEADVTRDGEATP